MSNYDRKFLHFLFSINFVMSYNRYFVFKQNSNVHFFFFLFTAYLHCACCAKIFFFIIPRNGYAGYLNRTKKKFISTIKKRTFPKSFPCSIWLLRALENSSQRWYFFIIKTRDIAFP